MTAEGIASAYKEYYDRNDRSIVFILPIMIKTADVPQDVVDRALDILYHTIGKQKLAKFEDDAFKDPREDMR